MYVPMYVPMYMSIFVVAVMACRVSRSCRGREECEPLRHPGVPEQNPADGQNRGFVGSGLGFRV